MASLQPAKKRILTLFLLVLVIVLITIWWVYTPATIDGKTRAVGYSVCHQIESHSIAFGDKILPLCARCTGMFLGTLVSLAVLSRRKKTSGSPSKGIIVILVFFVLAFILDGLNSMMGLFPVIPQLYPPSNLLRLVTGLMMGMVIANLLVVLWQQTWWKDSTPTPVLAGWKHLLLLIVANALAGLMVWLRIPFLYYPVAIFSTGAIVLLLSMIYSLIWVIIFKKENTFERYSDGLSFILAGLATAIIQIGLLDLLRYNLTGTWQGFTF
jgi:uncharacterized membrane protein